MIIASLLSGCASLSSALDLTHEETRTIEGQILIVTNDDALNQWQEILQSEKARGIGIRVIEKNENAITAISEKDEDLIVVARADYYPELCAYAEQSTSSGPMFEELGKRGIQVTRVHQETLENCKKGKQTRVEWGSDDGESTWQTLVTVTLYTIQKTTNDYKYQWIGTRCRDGWLSSSTGRGTCSWHGGVSGPAYGKRYIKKDRQE